MQYASCVAAVLLLFAASFSRAHFDQWLLTLYDNLANTPKPGSVQFRKLDHLIYGIRFDGDKPMTYVKTSEILQCALHLSR